MGGWKYTRRRPRRRLEAQGFPQTLLDDQEIVGMQSTEGALDQFLFDRQEVRDTSRARIAEADGLPMLERVITGAGPSVVTGLAADRAYDQVEERAVKGQVAHTDGGPRLRACLACEGHVDHNHLPLPIGSRRGHPLRLPRHGRASSSRAASIPAPPAPLPPAAGSARTACRGA